ncbi:protein lin-12-like [Porites lutea]|uniref:protein lin-12-like n=1 Tax=Porites lutea TaxID=51062 RepID=UPI003CC5BF63
MKGSKPKFSLLRDIYTLFCYYNPCKNGGTCKEHGIGYKCRCTPGFEGQTCEEQNFCKPNPCSIHAKCVETQDSFKCICEEGYKGEKCKDIDPCHPNPCQNDGICKDVQGKVQCECKPPHKGTFCTETLVCYHNPCHHGGTCVENPLAPCVCPNGYIGPHCEDHVCHPNPCVNGGSCQVENNTGHQQWTFKCECPRGFIGKLCHIPHPCLDFVCLNGGTCFDGQTTQDVATDLELTSRPLMNAVCHCLPGFTGKRCETKICDMCHINATCINNRCVCNAGFIGNGFQCEECSCLQATAPTGEPLVAKCDLEGECYCQSFQGRYPTYLADKGCQLIGKDLCEPVNPCKNNGSCLPQNGGLSYVCICPDKYYGKTCECTECLCNNPCLNNGVCVDISTHLVKCTCPSGFTGNFCEAVIPTVGPEACHSNPCVNKGTCVDRAFGSYDCICTPQFTGPHCEVDKCADCDINADCINGKCRCKIGYVGTGYACVKDEKEKECEEVVCPITQHCVRGVCVCLPGNFC